MNVTINNSGPAVPAGLVAAYSFEEGTGTSTADSSGQSNTGTLNGGVTWSTAGKSGKALSFNGTSGMVTIADKASLDLTGAMTLSAWVNPSAAGNWRTVMLKEAGTDLVYALYSSDTSSLPNVYIRTGRHRQVSGRHQRTAREHLESPRRDLRRQQHSHVSQRHAGQDRRRPPAT